MNIAPLHRWDLTPADAIALQTRLASTLIDRPIPLESVRLVAGVDVSVKPDAAGQPVSRAAIVVLSFPDLQPVETVTAAQPTPYPYIPGLLTFREGPVLVEAFAALHREPDVFLFDGMGRIHPRRMGIAAHMGLWLNRPTIGCGKTPFVGTADPVGPERGAYSLLRHHGDVIGAVVRTRANVTPMYISHGHLCDLESAIRLTLACTTRYRLPETTRAAHHAAGDF